MTPSPQFAESVSANIAYWREKTRLPVREKVNRLDRDRHNLLKAVEFGLALEATWSDTVELVLDCFELIIYQGYCDEWIPILESMLAKLPQKDHGNRLRIYHQLGNLYRAERRFDKTFRTHEYEEELATQYGSSIDVARVNTSIGKTHFLLRQHDDAEKRARIAQEILQDETAARDNYLNLLGLVEQARGNLDEALGWFSRSIEVFRRTDLDFELARVLSNQAITLDAAGKAEEALRSYREAEALLKPTRYELDKARISNSMGTLFFNLGDFTTAEVYYRQAYSPFMREAGPSYDIAMITNNLGNVYFAQDQYADAEFWLRRSIESCRLADAHLHLANALATLARVIVALGKLSQIEAIYEEAVEIIRNYPDDAFTVTIRKELELVREHLPMDEENTTI